MIRIGICDDSEKDREYLRDICTQHFNETKIEYELIFFESGEQVLAYCQGTENKRVDLLFLDIEMQGISGIEVKNTILKQDLVWRIVFVSCLKEKVFESFGLKTLGFVVKPIHYEEVSKWIYYIMEELKDDVYIYLPGSRNSENIEIRLEDMEYARADGNYTDIYLHSNPGEEPRRVLICAKIGELEKELTSYPIIRVHKSYLVNLMNITKMDKYIKLRDMDIEIPIGRSYRESTLKKYREYGKEKIRKRL